MAWTYSNWITQSTAAAQLASLRLHVQEVSDKAASADVAADGKSASYGNLTQYLQSLLSHVNRLENVTGTGAVNGMQVSQTRLTRTS